MAYKTNNGYKARRTAPKGYQLGSGTTGRVNMKRVDGGWMNQHGVVFTDEERKNLERHVKASNKVREEMLRTEAEVNEHRKAELNDLRTMGKESVYSISRQSKNMQSFQSVEDFENYMDKQMRIQTGEYQEERAEHYKKNFTDSLLETYGKEAQDIVDHVNTMKNDDYMLKVAGDEVLEISFVPSDKKVQGRLAQLRTHLGIPQPDNWVDEYED